MKKEDGMKKIYGVFFIFSIAVILLTFPLAGAAAAREGEAASDDAIGSSSQGSSNVNYLNDLMLDYMNDLRASVGVGPLSYDDTLNSYAGTRYYQVVSHQT